MPLKILTTLKSKLDSYSPNGSLEDYPQAAVLIICYESAAIIFAFGNSAAFGTPVVPEVNI